jgi:hypothetical protein
MTDAGMLMPALVFWMPMPTYDFVVCFLVSFDRSEVPTNKERVHLLLKFRFMSKFSIFASVHSELRKVKWRVNLS